MVFQLKNKNTYKYPEFSNALLRISPQELLGVAHFLGVKLYTEEKDDQDHPIPKDGALIIGEVLSKYETLNRKVRRELLSIVKSAGGKK